MEDLGQNEQTAPETRRLDDDTVNIGEPICMIAESFANVTMDAHAEGTCTKGNRRNGYPKRALVTSVARSACASPRP